MECARTARILALMESKAWTRQSGKLHGVSSRAKLIRECKCQARKFFDWRGQKEQSSFRLQRLPKWIA